MKYIYAAFLLPLTLQAAVAMGQKPFTEGTITYKIKLQTPDQKVFAGTYTFTIKDVQIRKELKLDNGYSDIQLLNCSAASVYSLQNRDGKKFAIQLSMSDMQRNQQQYTGFSTNNEQPDKTNIAGYAVQKANVSYKNGGNADVYYTREWKPTQTITFERFPDAKFLPLNFSYKDDKGMSMQFVAEQVAAGPVESAMFRIPGDYKMISNEEYKKLCK